MQHPDFAVNGDPCATQTHGRREAWAPKTGSATDANLRNRKFWFLVPPKPYQFSPVVDPSEFRVICIDPRLKRNGDPYKSEHSTAQLSSQQNQLIKSIKAQDAKKRKSVSDLYKDPGT